MPSISKAGAFLRVLVMTSAIITLITATVVAASSATTVGGRNDLDLVRKIKNSKKTNANHEDDTCTMEPFLGTSQYTNCAGEEMEVKIACANKGNAAAAAAAAAADITLTERLLCSYSEHPVQYEDAAAVAATAVGCGDHGSFDPRTHLTRDHVTGECRLKFVALTDSCDAAPVVAGDGFGVMVAAPLSTDNNHKDNSGLLLRFSTDAGATYYNNKDPSRTVPLDRSSRRRTLSTLWYKDKCIPACRTETFSGLNSYDKADYWATVDEPFAFVSCFRSYKSDKYCWTKSYWHETYKYDETKQDNHEISTDFFACHPYGESGEWEMVKSACKDIPYDPSLHYCFKDTDNAGKYCWYPEDNLPSGNWKGEGGHGENDCGSRCGGPECLFIEPYTCGEPCQTMVCGKNPDPDNIYCTTEG